MNLNLFFRLKSRETKHEEMFESRYTILLINARLEYHIEHVFIYTFWLLMFETYLFYQSSMCEGEYNFHANKSTKGLIQYMLYGALIEYL